MIKWRSKKDPATRLIAGPVYAGKLAGADSADRSLGRVECHNGEPYSCHSNYVKMLTTGRADGDSKYDGGSSQWRAVHFDPGGNNS